MLDGILSLLKPLLETLAGSNGLVLQVISIVGTVRLIMKPIMTMLHAVVDSTPSPADNAVLDGVEKSKLFSAVTFILDYILSIKLPTKA